MCVVLSVDCRMVLCNMYVSLENSICCKFSTNSLVKGTIYKHRVQLFCLLLCSQRGSTDGFSLKRTKAFQFRLAVTVSPYQKICPESTLLRDTRPNDRC